ncbi:tRNA dimethylallyltransferase [Sphingobacterium mizutaii NBRC 14946 = DSM 11724]|uniref:tRNA dimethylallyltransferase n=2 Tax=Sphingobacterium mizutaii TaxID=1010 RepID=A0AAJ4X8P6_9SPHI|nr:tRNA (adenosine(37)-N6)-dimethylallyltransferase MiaA [Sphingobacterium mizutaii]GEM67740.1 tRNA dimethylallyltransferase [Sphingobacterium mizutaii NBRC 14946 = DSM 11724]SDL70099.1 tRNA dimethylallyltransferase [Sphingobacterium mizutaii]SNV41936.1 tRNA dimethylallyltransferase [Sphingobacterium mizutaii]
MSTELNRQKTLIVVVGPTAVGKTALAIQLANHFKTSIISADSRQFYQEMSIGTAKPNAEELAQANHYFINSRSIAEDYTAGDFEREALVRLAVLFKSTDVVIAVGGSGLFVRALTEGLDDLPKAGEEIRDKLNEWFRNEGLEPLKQRLQEIDPAYYDKADIDNPQRVIRAIEVFEASGKPISYFMNKQKTERPFQVITIGLNTDREWLYNRINQRVDLMMEAGLLEEVKSLLPFRNKPALLTVGYAEIFEYLDGKISLEDAVSQIKQNSRRYAKRQITWFKKYGNTVWFEPQAKDEIFAYLDQTLKNKG